MTSERSDVTKISRYRLRSRLSKGTCYINSNVLYNTVEINKMCSWSFQNMKSGFTKSVKILFYDIN